MNLQRIRSSQYCHQSIQRTISPLSAGFMGIMTGSPQALPSSHPFQHQVLLRCFLLSVMSCFSFCLLGWSHCGFPLHVCNELCWGKEVLDFTGRQLQFRVHDASTFNTSEHQQLVIYHFPYTAGRLNTKICPSHWKVCLLITCDNSCRRDVLQIWGDKETRGPLKQQTCCTERTHIHSRTEDILPQTTITITTTVHQDMSADMLQACRGRCEQHLSISHYWQLRVRRRGYLIYRIP